MRRCMEIYFWYAHLPHPHRSRLLKGADTMKYEYLFYHKPDAEIRIYSHIRKPEAITSTKDTEYFDHRAYQTIHEAEELIKTLKEYRQELGKRYQEIITTNYSLFLFLKRELNYYTNTKKYVVTISKRFDGNNVADEEILREVYEGRDRHKALKRFEALQKQYPNIVHETDIEKKKWER